MNTRSAIQNHIQIIEAISNLKNRILSINEEFNIEEAVFGLDETLSPKQVVKGYMELSDEISSIEEGLKHLDSPSKAIYVKDSQHVYVGEFNISLDSFAGKKVLDIDTLKTIEL